MKYALIALWLGAVLAHAGNKHRHHNDPKCTVLKEACEKAGFRKGGHVALGKGHPRQPTLPPL